MNKSLIIIVNEDSFFLSHRLRIAELAKEKGWNVSIAGKDTGRKNIIEEKGFKFISMPINPIGMNLKEEMKLLRFLLRLFKNNQESVIHLVGLKNMLWGGIASKLVKKDRIVFAVSGLGTLFGEKKSNFITKNILKLLKVGVRGNKRAIVFQNHEDEALFKENRVSEGIPVFYLKGSGISLFKYSRNPYKKEGEPLKIIFTGRMLKEKGVEDLIRAAELLRSKYEGRIEFLLCGGVTNNKDSFTIKELQELSDGRYIKWLGFREDIPQLLADADIMCYPSYYREGVPKSLLEASAASLPIVTTDSVGCRDTVEDQINGFIVPAHSYQKFAEALEKLIEDEDLRIRMGTNSRKKAEKEYDVEKVANTHLEIYEMLINDSPK